MEAIYASNTERLEIPKNSLHIISQNMSLKIQRYLPFYLV